jgi:hypothetical protein
MNSKRIKELSLLLDQRMEGGVVKVVDVTIDLSPREIIPKYKMDLHPTGFLGEVIFLRLSVYFPKQRYCQPVRRRRLLKS